ncbi:putative transposase [Escherichia coli]|uniref:Putative transposase n=1 Tax=Escherichia coli TaxID=562 RepID=A0A2X3JT55_ECOLX|nr:putative transposase [Escherichia coli]
MCMQECPPTSPRKPWQRIGELYAIEAEVRGCTAEQRLAARKARAAPLMQSLYDWIQTQMKTLSRHSIRQKRSHTC